MNNQEQQSKGRLAVIRKQWALFLVVGVVCIVLVCLLSWAAWVSLARFAVRARHDLAGLITRGPLRISAAAPAPGDQGDQTTQATLWTCSMHPQIRKPNPGRCPICGMNLVPVTRYEGAGLREFSTSEAGRALMEIETSVVERKFVTAKVRMVGKIDYDETRLAYITAWVPGRIDRMFVDYTGVPVRKGDHMVELYSPELLSAQEELIQAIKAAKELKASDIGIVRHTAQAMVTAAREKLRLWGFTRQQIEAIEKRGKTSDRMTVYSPVGGIVITKSAQGGMYVKTGTRIYTIADLSKVWVKLDAYESDLMWLRIGQKVSFTTVSYPGEVFTGTISFIDPVLSSRTRTVKVRVNADNPSGQLKPGMFVKAVLKADVAAGGKVMDADLAGKWMCPMHPSVVKAKAGDCDICGMPLVRTESLGFLPADPTKADKPLVIPVSAALRTGTRAIVYVQIPGAKKPTYEGREIVLGPRAGDYYLVRSGLKEGQRVVTRGNFKIDSALQIQAKPSMMSPQGVAAPREHDHGKAKKTPGDGKTAVELPVLFRHQLRPVLAAAGDVKKAIAEEDLPKARGAFASLEKALAAVDSTKLSVRAKMLWKELSMRLTNDAVEGTDAKTLKEAARVGQSLAGNIASLKSKLRLEHKGPATRPAVSAEFRKQLGGVLDGYFKMQRALASDRGDEAVAAAKRMQASLGSVDAKLLANEQRAIWTKQTGELKRILTDTAKAGFIEGVRSNFALLSELMAAVAKRFAPPGRTIYQLRCPMAFNNRGATWLQLSQEVRNPYFGAAMLKCGSVQNVLLAAPGGAPATQPAESHGDHDHE